MTKIKVPIDIDPPDCLANMTKDDQNQFMSQYLLQGNYYRMYLSILYNALFYPIPKSSLLIYIYIKIMYLIKLH